MNEMKETSECDNCIYNTGDHCVNESAVIAVGEDGHCDGCIGWTPREPYGKNERTKENKETKE